MLKAVFSFLTIGILTSGFANAQYSQLLNPQTAEQVKKLKEQKVATKTIFIEVNGSQAPYGLEKYDTEGRILNHLTPKNRQYFTYDAAGKLVAFIDSVHDGRRFFKSEYAFAFDATGKPSNFKIDKVNSNFSYDAAKRELVENNGQGVTIYRYNEESKITEEVTEGEENPRYHKYLYNKYGDLATEIIASQNQNGTDTTRIFYTFDSKGKLLRKQSIQTLRMNESEDPTEPATFVKNVITTTYKYDLQTGFLASETVVCSDAKENCKTEWLYDNTGMLIKESRFDAGGKPTQAFVYKYAYIRK